MLIKIVVTHETALRQKYGVHFNAVKSAVDRLIAADALRGVATSLVLLDGSDMGRWKAKSNNPESFKDAIDHVFFLKGRPDYVVILGGPDVVPHQRLNTPLVGDAADEDRDIPSDLPYACNAPGSAVVGSFIGPSRVVSRVPDAQGENPDVSILVGLLDAAAKWRPKAKSTETYFGLSADVWEKSTRLSLRALFGAKAEPRTSPLEGPKWTSSQLSPMWHFINCHGAPVDPHFYGQKGNDYPVAQQADTLPSRIRNGTVVAAECCYGAEVYDPVATTGPGICMAYLVGGAIAFMGSTTIAYGPSDSNASADLICRYFIESCMSGASTGRAFLEARQRFAKEASPLSPVDLKTLAQFILLGDGGLRAVTTNRRGSGKTSLAKASAFLTSHIRVRGALAEQAVLLTRGGETASDTAGSASKSIHNRMADEARSAGYAPGARAMTFEVTPARDVVARSILATGRKSAGGRKDAGARPDITRFHVLQATAGASGQDGDGAKAMTGARIRRRAGREVGSIPKRMVVVGREVAGKVVEIRRYYAHAGIIAQCPRRTEDE